MCVCVCVFVSSRHREICELNLIAKTQTLKEMSTLGTKLGGEKDISAVGSLVNSGGAGMIDIVCVR